MSDLLKMTRRDFAVSVAAVGGGMALGFHLPGLAGDTRRKPRGAS